MSLSVRPFLKWPGGKFRLVQTLRHYLPPAEVLIEPFVGAGSIFLNLDYPVYHLNDLNADLITIYAIARQKTEAFIRGSKALFTKNTNQKEMYYRLRERFNRSSDPYQRSILFLYLNRHGYNGLCRYNQKGGYNVPFGDVRKPYFPEAELQHYAKRAHRVHLFQEDFRDIMLNAPKHSVIYCDPPYLPLGKSANFTSYAGNTFSWEAHEKLAACARALARRKIPVIISNHDLSIARELYRGAKMISIPVARTMSCHGHSRMKVNELIAVF